MTLPARAEALARHLLSGQTDKLGRPYIEHLEAVVSILLRRWPDAPEEAVAAAWLHDALEDTGATLAMLADQMVPVPVGRLVFLMTKPPGMTYRDYIARLATRDPWAIRIKLADLEHNMDPARAIPGSDLVARRYEPARRVLEQALRDRGDTGVPVTEQTQ